MKLLIATLATLVTLGAHAESPREHMQRELVTMSGQKASIFPNACSDNGNYVDGMLTCGITSSGAIGGSGDCASPDGFYVDIWELEVVAGNSYSITFSGSRPSLTALLLVMRSVGGEIVEVVRRTGTGSLTVSFVAPASGIYGIGFGWVQPLATVTYTLLAPCGSSPPPPPSTGNCVPTSTTACLLGNRFAVDVRYRSVFDNGPVNAQARVKPVTGFGDASYETAFFYFNSPNNIEVMVKMLDQGNRDSANRPTIAVLYGSATPLRLEVTITDTRFGGVTRTWTSSFGTQAGQTDFTAFVK